jgi:perosamine synthetase
MAWKIPLFRIYWDQNDIEAVTAAINAGENWAIGPNVEIFEKELSSYIGSKYALSFNSGTSALHALLLSYDIKNYEVIVPSFTFIATANAPLFVGGKPVFADIEEKTFGLNPEDVKKKITARTKAIIPIHYGGSPCLINQLKEIANDNNILLIEDAAESLGAKLNGAKVGTFGEATILSFCQNKIISTGEGGAIVTNSQDLYEKLKLIRSHGRLENQNYFSTTAFMDYVSLGYNFRMSNITAALGNSQLKKIERIISLRQQNARYLSEKLKNVNEVTLPFQPIGFEHVYQLYTIQVNSNMRDQLMEHLATKGIMTKVYFPPVHLSDFYRNTLKYNCELPITEKIAKQTLSLPMYPTLKKEEIEFIVSEIKNFFNQRASIS